MARRPRQGRRGGAGSPIPLIIFIVLFVFSFAGFVMMLKENHRLWDDIHGSEPAKALPDRFLPKRQENQKTQGYLYIIDALHTRFINKTAAYDQLAEYVGFNEKGIAAHKKHVDEMREQTNIKAGDNDIDTLTEYEKRLEIRNQELQHRITQLKNTTDEAREARDQAVKDRKSDVTAKEATITTIRTEIAARDQKYSDEASARDEEIKMLRQKISDNNEKHLVESEKNKSIIAQRERKIIELEGIIEQLIERPTDKFDPQLAEVDGKVLVVNLSEETVMIDIGRKDGARKGLRFDVYEVGVGGVRRLKGQIEIKSVHPEVSYAGIITMGDKLDPILADNILISPTYQRGKPLLFTIEPQDFDKTDIAVLKTKLERFGNKLVMKPEAGVRYCIIGNNVKKDSKLRQVAKECARLNIPVIRAMDIEFVLGAD